MLTTLFFVITDFKTIKVPEPVVPAETDLLAELIYFASLVAPVFAVVIFAVWLWQRPTRPTLAKPEYWILVDGSNVMHWQDNAPSLHPVREVVEKLTGLGYVPGIVFDANAGWKLQGRYLHDGELARLLGVEDRQVLVVPKGTQADPYLLETAREFEAKIVTNDRYRDWAEQYPDVLKPGFLIKGGMRDGTVWLQGVTPVGADVISAKA